MTITDSRPTKTEAVTDAQSSAGSDSRAADPRSATNLRSLREPNSRTAEPASAISHATVEDSPTERLTSRGPDSRRARLGTFTTGSTPAGSNSHATGDLPVSIARASRGSNSRPASTLPMSKGSAPDGAQPAAHQKNSDNHAVPVGGDQQGRDRAAVYAAAPDSSTLLDPALSLAADFLDDIERVKLANGNRLRALLGGTKEAEQEARYAGLTEGHPVVAKYAEMVDALGRIEHDAVLTLQRLMRKHPLGAWVKAQRGIGEKQAARLLASIGDPYWRPEIVKEDGTVIPEGPRTVSALWAYSGLHVLPAAGLGSIDAHRPYASGGSRSPGGDSGHSGCDIQVSIAGVAARRRKGEQANWSTKAKTRAYLIAESCLKQLVKPCHTPADGPTVHVEDCGCSPYRLVYDRRKAHTATSRPDWTDGHRHADALRVSSKAILRDLWRAARDWHLAQKESEA